MKGQKNCFQCWCVRISIDWVKNYSLPAFLMIFLRSFYKFCYTLVKRNGTRISRRIKLLLFPVSQFYYWFSADQICRQFLLDVRTRLNVLIWEILIFLNNFVSSNDILSIYICLKSSLVRTKCVWSKKTHINHCSKALYFHKFRVYYFFLNTSRFPTWLPTNGSINKIS